MTNDPIHLEPGQGQEVLSLPAKPLSFYRMTAETRSQGPGYWFADFYDGAGVKNYADNYSSTYAAADWSPVESVFFSRAGTERIGAGFRAIAHPLAARNLRVEPIGREEAGAWLERQEGSGVWPRLPACGGAGIERIRERLRQAGTVRWVGLGDSLSNDLLNGMGHLWIERVLPGLRIDLIHANGPEKFAEKYNDEAVLDRLVYPHRPEVFMFGGLSHTGQDAAIRDIFQRVRRACGDIPALYVHVDAGAHPLSPATLEFLKRMDAMGRQDRFAVMDLSAPWRTYLDHSPHPHAWYMRDKQHVNDRGKIVLGRLLADFVTTAPAQEITMHNPPMFEQLPPPFRLRTAAGPIDDWRLDGEGYESPSAGLRVEVVRIPRGAAIETTTYLENRRDEPSPLITHVCFFRKNWAIEEASVPVVHHSGGGLTDAVFPGTAWRQYRSELIDWSSLRLEGAKGRSNNKDLPIFIVADESDTGGIAFVAGYSGHVVNTITREVDYRSVTVESGIHELQLRLPSQARMRLGSMLVLPYEGDLDAGRNLLRRTLRDHLCPSSPQGRVRPEVTYVHWFGIERNYTAESLLQEAAVQAELGTEIFEVDAAWATQGTHKHYGAGNWAHENREKFPDGITAFADRIRSLGLRFGLWIEPETVEEGTAIHREHPEWLITREGEYRYLLDYGNPDARAYITELVSGLYTRYGVEWTRMDSNLDLHKYFATIADPGERGFRELRHWEGWYAFLDTLLERHPDLHVEGCSSGGRRIDLEMIKRSHSFWISDNTNYQATIHQHIGGANRWLPAHLLNMEAVKYPLFPQKVRPYDQVGDETFTDFWLATLMGGLFGLGGPHTQYPVTVNEKFKRFIAKYKEIRPLLDGDFYPLLPQPSSSADWDAWQFHHPDTEKEMLLVFRMRGGPDTFAPRMRALEPNKIFRLNMFPSGKTAEWSGADLTGGALTLELSPWGADVICYE